jgi:hypothetical protein
VSPRTKELDSINAKHGAISILSVARGSRKTNEQALERMLDMLDLFCSV